MAGQGNPSEFLPLPNPSVAIGMPKDRDSNSLLHIFLEQIADEVLGIIGDFIKRLIIEIPGG